MWHVVAVCASSDGVRNGVILLPYAHQACRPHSTLLPTTQHTSVNDTAHSCLLHVTAHYCTWGTEAITCHVGYRTISSAALWWVPTDVGTQHEAAEGTEHEAAQVTHSSERQTQVTRPSHTRHSYKFLSPRYAMCQDRPCANLCPARPHGTRALAYLGTHTKGLSDTQGQGLMRKRERSNLSDTQGQGLIKVSSRSHPQQRAYQCRVRPRKWSDTQGCRHLIA